MDQHRISQNLVGWYRKNKRDLPWRSTRDPYRIWLSEIILQQTRVNQGLPYYQQFVSRFPNIQKFAEASEDDVLKLWQGLGYYSRARNMMKAARQVVLEYAGRFPDQYDKLLQIKGIGPYSAAAIASFAFKKPHAVVDGNVKRVLSRLFCIESEPDSMEGKKIFTQLASLIMDPQNPSEHNQAIMELGALICKPRSPLCPECPLAQNCEALAKGKVGELPVKGKRARVRNRYFNYFLIRSGKSLYLRKRPEGDIWQALYDFPLIETKKPVSSGKLTTLPEFNALLNGREYTIHNIGEYLSHKLTHQHIYARLSELSFTDKLKEPENFPWIKIPAGELNAFPVPRLVEKLLITERITEDTSGQK